METQAYFSNIRSQIQSELKSATVSIHVAVAWFTDAKLFALLCDKAKAGLDVQLIMVDDPITQNCSINYNSLEQSGGKVYLINENNGALMHNKFCVIDGETTITGSYNWSIKAQSNHENITITRDYKELADLFIEEFKRIKILYHGEDPLKRFDADIICKRLSIIDNLIQLQEFEQITNHATKINEHELTVEVNQIIQLLNQPDYESASVSIRNYLVRIKSVTQFTDADIERLKWEIKYLEIEIISLENEKSSIEKIISDFVHNYNMAFGDVLIEILKLKKEKLKKAGNNRSAEYEKAEQEYNDFKKEYNQTKKDKLFDLSEEEQDDLKKLYRKAIVLCHPDKFTDDEMKIKAHKVFVELQDAYTKNDLNRVQEILYKLENGIFEIDEKTTISDKEQLLRRVEYLRLRRDELNSELIKIRNDKSYRDIISIKNMDNFYDEEKIRLETILNNLKNEQ
ncbi:MAG: DUF1669 domain-containing protein [Bacteroidales bacterium]|nr:DUF1669 domain-containing protein [Bacteroidales bacterium]